MNGYKSYTGVAFLLVVILISVLGNVLFQVYLFPIFPYPIFVSLVSAAFPALCSVISVKKGYAWEDIGRYIKIAPIMLLNSIISGILFNWGLLLTSMSAVTVISSSSTLFSLLFSRILLKTPVYWATIISINMSMIGSILVILSSSNTDLPVVSSIAFLTDDSPTVYSDHLLGCVLALISSALSGLSTVLYQRLNITDTNLYLSISGVAGIGYLIIYCTVNKFLYKFESLVVSSAATGTISEVVIILVMNGLISSVFGYFLYIEALNRLKSPLTVNVLFAISIPMSVLIDYYRGQVHSVTPSFLIGALLVIASTVLVPFEKPPASTDNVEIVIQLADPELCRDIPLLVFPDED